MAILRKPVGYVNSSCVTLMGWVKTLRQSKRKIIVSKVSCHDSLFFFISCFLEFQDLVTFKSMDQLICRMPLKLHLFDVSSQFDSICTSLAEISQI